MGQNNTLRITTRSGIQGETNFHSVFRSWDAVGKGRPSGIQPGSGSNAASALESCVQEVLAPGVRCSRKVPASAFELLGALWGKVRARNQSSLRACYNAHAHQ